MPRAKKKTKTVSKRKTKSPKKSSPKVSKTGVTFKNLPSVDTLNKDYNLGKFEKFVENSTHKEYFLGVAGKEHYQLLAWTASQFKKGSKIADLGTFKGLSALALSFNDDIEVHTYDPSDKHLYKEIVEKRDNVTFHQKDCREDITELAKFDFIFIDVDPHDGAKELSIINALKEHGYKGYAYVDDIKLNSPMVRMWDNLEMGKKDISDIGHYSGTGVIKF